MPTRLFTVDQANTLLGTLDEVVARAQGLTAEMRTVRDQLVDLRIIWAEKVLDPACPDYAEYEAYRAKFTRLERELQAATAEVAGHGCELKDLEQGLVDFYTHRGEEVVYLCWKRGEPRIRWWHPVEGGFGARRPIDTL